MGSCFLLHCSLSILFFTEPYICKTYPVIVAYQAVCFKRLNIIHVWKNKTHYLKEKIFMFFNLKNIYLAVLRLSCGMWDLVP